MLKKVRKQHTQMVELSNFRLPRVSLRDEMTREQASRAIAPEPQLPGAPLKTEPVGQRSRLSPAAEAWILMHRIHWAEKPRFMAIGQEFDLTPQQGMALRALERPLPMRELARFLACDSSNVTGIVDRLEQRALVRRTSAEHDRRIKLLVLTNEGHRVRREIERRITEPPAAITALPEPDQRKLRDLLRKALERPADPQRGGR
jgi:MarR family transcriptional regulator, organic hydroperoxide resistance regulator